MGCLNKSLVLIVVSLIFLSSFVIAQDENISEEDSFEELKEEYAGEEISNAGITPDSPFYFLDEFFGRFGNDINNREEKVAEIKAMIEKGDYESARKALKKYYDYAEELENDADPEKREEARRSSAVIRNTLDEIKENIPEEERAEFYEEIVEKEKSILTAVEISSKIKELCIELAELDPLEYSRMCKTDDSAPEWKKKLDKDLTDDQKTIAKEFVSIMKDCFKTSGQDCRCEEIPFVDFSLACSEAAPLATACDINGDERACEKLDDLDMPELPDYLQEIWEKLERRMMESQFEMHMPRECVEAGVTTPRECGKIMIETGAPEECKQPLLDSGCDSERECMEICDKIMMKIHAPDCVEKGITDMNECARFMDSFRGPDGPREIEGRRIDFDCKGIADANERLDCYDKASSQAKGFGGFHDGDAGNCMTESDWQAKKQECRNLYGESAGDEPIMGDSGNGYECPIDAKCIDFSQGNLDFEEIKIREKECANRCEIEGGAWDFSYGECKCYFDNRKGQSNPYEGCGAVDCVQGFHCEYGGCVPDKRDDFPEGGCGDCASKCPGASGTDCINNRCECYYEEHFEEQPFEKELEEPLLESGSVITGEIVRDKFLDYYYN
jgi:hypothetical protein